jgi:hypothetical protein
MNLVPHPHLPRVWARVLRNSGPGSCQEVWIPHPHLPRVWARVLMNPGSEAARKSGFRTRTCPGFGLGF